MDIHLLMSLAAAGAIALADYAEAAAVVVLFAVAEHWERCSTDKVRLAAWLQGLAGWMFVYGWLLCGLLGLGLLPWNREAQAAAAAAPVCFPPACAVASMPFCVEPFADSCCLARLRVQARDAVAAVLTLRPESGAA